MKLSIDTTNNLQTKITLGSRHFTQLHSSPRNQDLITFLTSIFQSHGFSLDQISQIYVNPGPGSFTSIRTGITVAVTLSLILNIPINNLPPGSTIKPHYGCPPSIT